ncbi:DNA-binding protein H-NS [Paraburkholderia bannensis]|uniref:DNA-binding protein H-NS n=1 Tax=Paraburkholderia bannensis TaxID=765414 RepID=A0A7W9WR36_9BURK|nr:MULTISPECIES: H-NS family nucleoid-associated regulatory protein [Paraburkholderia]MBB3257737.1 DNA-binding protein H-NS [Paraburkholderia sp. WP4_3_2]MBB6102750.1 DNA-binding protein H-NS [Paraburkholderia bannensis]
MATYLELLAEKRALDARIEAARAEAAQEALATARAAIAEFGFTPEDLFGKPRQAKAAKTSKGPRGKHKAAQDAANANAGNNNFDLFGH